VRANPERSRFPVQEEGQVAWLESPNGLGATRRVLVAGKNVKPKIFKKNSGASIQRRQYVALSEHADVFSAQRVFRAGARAYLSIEDAPELLRAFDEISTGHPYVGASALPLILSNFAAGLEILVAPISTA